MLNRAVWSPRQAARILLMLLLQHLDQGDGPLVFGIDETLERRRGPKIKSLGIYRDTDWARQMILQLRRWLPHRPRVVARGRLWTCSTAANRWLNPLPSSPACAWTPPFMRQRHPVSRARTVGLR